MPRAGAARPARAHWYDGCSRVRSKTSRDEPGREASARASRHHPAGRLGRFPGGVLIGWLVVAAAVAGLSQLVGRIGEPALPFSYTEFRNAVEDDRVASVRVKGDRIEGELAAEEDRQVGGRTVSGRRFVTHVPSFGDPGLLAALEQGGVEVHAAPEEWPSLAWRRTADARLASRPGS